MALSEDLRKRVIECVTVEGLSCRAAAARMRVGVSTAIRWIKEYKTSGATRGRSPGGDKRSGAIEKHADYILGVVRRTPDLTLLELQERLIRTGSGKFAISTLWRFFERHDITYKKNGARRRTAAAGRERKASALV
jgi:transposase